ncbi:uncharacterized protein AB675_11395 [Cyphellophora attinorum]|uniref:Uncharacterized protein n=1 Tax=Cyphellophora attinorum TaxID=1664694 RepID=A0A0N0NM68_9EURO|nr:uncharacterized protein AB675_11395 [Phialophora attinorum]KPI39859.1 hypothetical protein AB675_11395 [Phialophora attinorum]
MPAGPYPTAFDAVVTHTAPTEPRNDIRRPLSAAPSYTSLPPYSSTNPMESQSVSNPLLAAAHATPGALISTMTLTNHTSTQARHPHIGTAMHVSRYLSARTSDNRERYRLESVDGSLESIVWRDATLNGHHSLDATGKDIVGRLVGGSQELSAIIGPGSKSASQRPFISMNYVAIQKTGRLEVPAFTVEGQHVGMKWEVVGLADSVRNSTNLARAGDMVAGRRSSSGTLPSRVSMDAHDQKRQHAGISFLRLVDNDGNVYAEYSHDVGLPDLHKDGELWGELRLYARSVLIDGEPGGGLGEKMDRAFLTLVLLLEASVRVLGGNKKGERNWGNFAGSMGCIVM